MTDPIRSLLAEMAEEIEGNRRCLMGDSSLVHPLAERARAALAAAPPAPAPTINDLLELCEDHEFHLGIDGANEEESAESLLQIIRIALSRWGNQPPAPDHLRTATEMVADGEREELAQWMDRFHEYAYELGRPDWGHMTTRAAALLRQPAPAPVPVVVSERLPEQGDCDAEGRCWVGCSAQIDQTGDFDAEYNASWELSPVHPQDEVWLPHWALPRPPQGGEVAE